MATVTAVIASTHHRFYYRASTATGEDRPPFADEWAAKIEPIVPIYTNIFAPPLPRPKRLVEAWPSEDRVAIIGTGHLSLELGSPRQFGSHGPDPEFDRKAIEWIASRDITSALAEVSLESLWLPGNATLTWCSATRTTRAAQSNGGSQRGPTSS